MSILIRGVNYPRSSPLTLIIYQDGTVSSVYDNQRGTAVPVLPHGRLIDADEFLSRAIGTRCFHGDYALVLEELVRDSTTVIPACPQKEET